MRETATLATYSAPFVKVLCAGHTEVWRPDLVTEFCAKYLRVTIPTPANRSQFRTMKPLVGREMA